MWKDVPGYEGAYQANAQGQIYSLIKKRILKCHRNRRGYMILGSKHGGRFRLLFVHALVLETFVGPRPKGMQCRHLNGDPADNRLDNLRWGTCSENQNDRWVHHLERIKQYYAVFGRNDHEPYPPFGR